MPGRTIAAILMVLLAVACDPVASLVFHNQTGESVVVEHGSRRVDPPEFNLEPGETKRSSALMPNDKAQQRVEARDATGTLIFCRVYTGKEMHDWEIHVDIQRGLLACPDSPGPGSN
jgi:hypothetical protein